MISINRPVGAARQPKKRRLIASAAVGAAVVLATTGCNMIAPQATTISYSAAEGVNIDGSGPLDVRNVFIVATEDGSEGNLIAAIVNATSESHTLHMEFGDGPTANVLSMRVPPNTVISLGADEEPILLPDLDTPPGADIPAYFQSGDSEGVLAAVPVLDGALDYLAPFVP